MVPCKHGVQCRLDGPVTMHRRQVHQRLALQHVHGLCTRHVSGEQVSTTLSHSVL